MWLQTVIIIELLGYSFPSANGGKFPCQRRKPSGHVVVRIDFLIERMVKHFGNFFW